MEKETTRKVEQVFNISTLSLSLAIMVRLASTALYHLFKNGYYYQALCVAIFIVIEYLENAILSFEEFFVLRKMKRPVFILGAPRSGTTALHESIYKSVPNIASFTVYDLFFRPVLLKLIFRPIIRFINFHATSFSTKGHKFYVNSLLEEHFLLSRCLLFSVPVIYYFNYLLLKIYRNYFYVFQRK